MGPKNRTKRERREHGSGAPPLAQSAFAALLFVDPLVHLI